jgi:hypothetical protein
MHKKLETFFIYKKCSHAFNITPLTTSQIKRRSGGVGIKIRPPPCCCSANQGQADAPIRASHRFTKAKTPCQALNLGRVFRECGTIFYGRSSIVEPATDSQMLSIKSKQLVDEGQTVLDSRRLFALRVCSVKSCVADHGTILNRSQRIGLIG